MPLPTLPRVLAAIGAVFLAGGLIFAVQTASFLEISYPAQATVVRGEEYRGPPRLPGAARLKVTYRAPGGESYTAETAAPYLRKLEPGDSVPILVHKVDPHKVRLPFITELWKWPLGLSVGGLGLLLFSLLAHSVKRTVR